MLPLCEGAVSERQITTLNPIARVLRMRGVDPDRFSGSAVQSFF